MWRCFICGHESIVWDSDFDTQDLDIVSYFHCTKCGADYEVLRIFEDEEE